MPKIGLLTFKSVTIYNSSNQKLSIIKYSSLDNVHTITHKLWLTLSSNNHKESNNNNNLKDKFSSILDSIHKNRISIKITSFNS